MYALLEVVTYFTTQLLGRVGNISGEFYALDP